MDEAADSPIAVIALRGELDLTRTAELKEALAPAFGAMCAVIDVTRVHYMDSTAIAAFMRLRGELAPGGRLYIVSPDVRVMRLARVSGLGKFAEIVSTVDAALAHFNHSAALSG